MTVRRLTASGLELAEHCPAAYALPAVEDAETDAMRAGTGRHAYLSAIARAFTRATENSEGTYLDEVVLFESVRNEALATVPTDAPWRATCEGIDVAALLHDVVSIEPDLCHVLRLDGTAEALSVEAHRAYPDTDGVPGTLDWLVIRADGSVEVIDFKGAMPTTPAARNLQLALYALQVARDRGYTAVTVALVYVHEDGSTVRDAATLDAWDLDASEEAIARIRDGVFDARAQLAADAAPDMSVGTWCDRCPAIRVCPAQIALVRELVASPPNADELPTLSDDDAGAAWEILENLSAVVERMRASLRVRALRAGLPLPGGRSLVPVESTRRSVDARRALPVLRELVGDRADGLVEHSLSTGAVTSLVREFAKASGDKISARSEAVWEQLRAAGAVTESRFVQLRTRANSGARGERTRA